MARAHCSELLLPDALTAAEATWHETQTRLDAVLRGPHIRLLSYVDKLNIPELELERRAQLALQKTPLGRRYLEQETRTLTSILSAHPAWTMRHFILTWGKTLDGLQAYLRPAVFPPEPLGGVGYQEATDYLTPLDRRHPYARVIGSYELRGVAWDWEQPWGQLMGTPTGPTLFCLDFVRLTETQMRMARQTSEALWRAKPGDKDLAKQAHDINQALYAGDEFYQMRLFILLTDPVLDNLNQRTNQLIQTYENRFGLTRLPGQQLEGLEFFGAMEKPALAPARAPVNAHSFVLGRALPVSVSGLAGINNRVDTTGVYIGFRSGYRGQMLGPLHWSPFSASDRAPHIGIVGQIGSGKSVLSQAFLARSWCTAGTPFVWMDPMGLSVNTAKLLASDPAMHYTRLDWDSIQINPLDWVGNIGESAEAERDAPRAASAIAAGMGRQFDHVKATIDVMLGEQRMDGIQEGLLSKALDRVYAGLTEKDLEAPEKTPRLELLCDVLQSMAGGRNGEKAVLLADLIAMRYVDGAYGKNFNQPTNMPLTFNGAHLFDTSKIQQAGTGGAAFATILNFTLIAWFMRACYRDKRAYMLGQGPKVQRIFALDEYYANVADNPWMQQRLNIMARTLRNLYVCMLFSEQLFSTFAKGGNRSIVGNLPFWFFGRQDREEAHGIAELFGDRCPPDLLAVLPSLGQGQFVALLDQPSLVRAQLLPMELSALVR